MRIQCSGQGFGVCNGLGGFGGFNGPADLADLTDSEDSADSVDLGDSYFNPHLDHLYFLLHVSNALPISRSWVATLILLELYEQHVNHFNDFRSILMKKASMLSGKT